MSERLKKIECRLAQIENTLGRIEASLDLLLEALAAEDDEEQLYDLDGNPAARERGTTESLD